MGSLSSVAGALAALAFMLAVPGIGFAQLPSNLGSLESHSVEHVRGVLVDSTDPAVHLAAITAGLPDEPFLNTTIGGTEGSTATVGTLRLGLNPNAFPVIVRKNEQWTDVVVAGSHLGDGRVVAFSGQDFLGPDERATLLGHANTDLLLANAVRWVGDQSDAGSLRILVDNQRIANSLAGQGLQGITVVDRRGPYERNWSASALDDADIVVVLTNAWGTPMLAPDFVPGLHAFVTQGGGLIIAGSALHWDWWIQGGYGRFTGNALLEDAGISWNVDNITEIESATTKFDLQSFSPGGAWRDYISGEPIQSAQVSLLSGLFMEALKLGRLDEVDAALARLVREAPRLPVPATNPQARLSAEVASSLGPVEWPEMHPWAAAFPGVPDQSSRVNESVVVDATGNEFPAGALRRERYFPLGFYAPPGGLVTIEVPASHTAENLKISVGWDHNDLRPLQDWHPTWRRAPALQRIFDITSAETMVTNAWGGSISIVVPASFQGTIPVAINGAIPMAVYTAGQSNADDWYADLDAGAPQAVIQNFGGIRLVLSAESARRLSDPKDVAEFWNGFYRHHAELAGEPEPRAYESIWIFDPQVGYGYANAGWMTINYPLHGENWAIMPGTAAGRDWLATLPSIGPTRHTIPRLLESYSPEVHGVDWWLFGHELGHQWQTEDWGSGSTYPEIGEVAVNLFTMYTLNGYVFGGGDADIIADPRLPNSVDHAALFDLNWPEADLFQRLELYRQLIFEFGWDTMKTVFRSYFDPAYPRSAFGSRLDGFAIRFSAIVERDLVSFFEYWNYPLTESAASTIRSFGHMGWLPPGWGENVAAVSFSNMITDQSYARAQAIDPLVLPEATGGVPPVIYALTPELPTGLTFDAPSRTIKGTPTVVTTGPVQYKYKATDARGSTDSLLFGIEVYAPVPVEHESVPETFAVRGNYPNPFGDVTSLVLDLPWSASVTVEVWDALGRRVSTAPAVELLAGWKRKLQFYGAELPSGLYLYRVHASSPEGSAIHAGRFVRIR